MIKKGKILDINKNYNDWFLGSFVKDPEFNTASSQSFEVKWSKRKKGYLHPFKQKTNKDMSCKSMSICMYGKSLFSFLDEFGNCTDYLLEQEGDFVFWTPNLDHKVQVLEDSLILTIRWYKNIS